VLIGCAGDEADTEIVTPPDSGRELTAVALDD
jgi:hypothetical protein